MKITHEYLEAMDYPDNNEVRHLADFLSENGIINQTEQEIAYQLYTIGTPEALYFCSVFLMNQLTGEYNSQARRYLNQHGIRAMKYKSPAVTAPAKLAGFINYSMSLLIRQRIQAENKQRALAL